MKENHFQDICTLFLEVFQCTVSREINTFAEIIFKNLLNNIGKLVSFQNTVLMSTAISTIFHKEPNAFISKGIKKLLHN